MNGVCGKRWKRGASNGVWMSTVVGSGLIGERVSGIVCNNGRTRTFTSMDMQMGQGRGAAWVNASMHVDVTGKKKIGVQAGHVCARNESQSGSGICFACKRLKKMSAIVSVMMTGCDSGCRWQVPIGHSGTKANPNGRDKGNSA